LYLIRLPSGDERTYATIDELAAALEQGEVGPGTTIYHRRTARWVPLQQHPYFAFVTGLQDAPPAATPPAPAPPQLDDEGFREAPPPPPKAAPPPPPPRPAQPLDLEPIAPTPMRMPKPEPVREEPFRPEPLPRPVVRQPPAGISPPKTRRTGLFITLIVVLGSAVGIMVGLKLRQSAGGDETAGPSFRPAPAPSSLLGDSTPTRAAAPPARTSPATRLDPTAPTTAADLMARRQQAYLTMQNKLGQELAAVDFNSIFGVRALSSPEGARTARRVVASALNIMGQFHRQEFMTDKAYEDTAAFQTNRAGWSRDQIAQWQGKPTLKEAYQSADLAESLLADADSLLSILGSGTQWTIQGDSLGFAEPTRAAAYRAQRFRLLQRASAPVTDTTIRPTLAYVRGAIEPSVLPPAADGS
jgi:outer membrane biosynthesis protein TonB